MISCSHWGWWGFHDQIQTFRGFFFCSMYNGLFQRVYYMYLRTSWLNNSWISSGREHAEAKRSVSNCFFARLPHQQPFTEQKDPLSHPAGVWVTHERRGSLLSPVAFIIFFSKISWTEHFQGLDKCTCYCLADMQAIKPIFFDTTCGGGRRSTSIHCMVELIKDIRLYCSKQLHQTSAVKLYQSCFYDFLEVVHFWWRWCLFPRGWNWI